MGAFEDYISGSWQGIKRGAQELPENIANWARPAAQEGIKGYDGAITGTDLPYYGDDEISAAREQFDKQPRSSTSRLVDLIGNYMPGLGASKVAPVAVRAGETVLGAGPAFKQKVAETALDMAPEARAARAADMGYNLDAYHGTKADFPAFDPTKGEGFVHVGDARAAYDRVMPPGTRSTRDEEAFAQNTGAQIMPLKVKAQNPVDMPDVRIWDDPKAFLTWATKQTKAGNTVPNGWKPSKKMFSELTDLANGAAGADNPREVWREGFRSALTKAGHDSVRYVNDFEGSGRPSYMLLDPSQIRSRFAAFDPAKSGSSDLLAAHANPLASLNELYRNREEQ